MKKKPRDYQVNIGGIWLWSAAKLATLIIIGLLLCARAASAGTITASITSGQCFTPADLPNRITVNTTEADGFIVYAAHGRGIGCVPHIDNPTSGVYRTYTNVAGLYEVEFLKEWMPTCDHLQLDVESRSTGELWTMLLDTGVLCVTDEGRVSFASVPPTFPPDYVPPFTPPGDPPFTPPGDPPFDPPGDPVCPTCVVDPRNPTPVPEPGTFVTVAIALGMMLALRLRS